MDPRKQKILHAIIEQFISTAEPVGSQSVILSYHLEISPATVRNEMILLEKEGFIIQPHTSAGRIPTELGYRYYLEELADFAHAKQLAKSYLAQLRKEYLKEQLKQKIFHAISFLAKISENICFATVPDNYRTFYLGVSNMLKQPEFQKEPAIASQVIEVLEEESHFIKALTQVDIGNETKIFIGNENVIPQIVSCSVIVCKYRIKNFQGFIGILGPKRMNYPFTVAILEEVRDLLSA